ncbi:type II toxin-antitoxin system RelE/ParE family toxin [Marinomonas colpomeniae]|uniref:Type II toxin-antitoxin system RelE/ParE family toxin n=1 Tax=Marinomonas colpomeniae TaxID=2774408 RepID=A0ABR8P021_9GAMM|nr:type II toxin-antitoxin system RelE/ParE family toxin [Marinomonas colpomeniae]MBD5771631.1 type II toxin-antitoxin system RelE/ParE family toxin [Marinomonas colpomeniae]
MAEIVWTVPALNEINDIADYISLSNQNVAEKLVTSIFETIERLESHPESGKVPAEIPTLNYRKIVVNPCRIFYKFESDKVFILHVMRQEQDLRRFLLT